MPGKHLSSNDAQTDIATDCVLFESFFVIVILQGFDDYRSLVDSLKSFSTDVPELFEMSETPLDFSRAASKNLGRMAQFMSCILVLVSQTWILINLVLRMINIFTGGKRGMRNRLSFNHDLCL